MSFILKFNYFGVILVLIDFGEDTNPEIFNFFKNKKEIESLSPLEKYALIYQRAFESFSDSDVDINEIIRNLCACFNIWCLPQNYELLDKDGNVFQKEANLICLNDEKYNKKSIYFSDAKLENCVSKELSFNLCFVPLKYVDGVNVSVKSSDCRIKINDNTGLFYSGNKENFDIMAMAECLNISSSELIKIINNSEIENFKFEKIINVIKKYSTTNVNYFDKYLENRSLYFAGQNDLDSARNAVKELALKFEGMPIIKDNQNTTFDCASFVTYMFMSTLSFDITKGGIGNSLTGKIMSSAGGKLFLIDEYKSLNEKVEFIHNVAKIGDVLLFHRQSRNETKVIEDNWFPGHVGIYIGDGKYIDARHRRGDVKVVDINDDLYMDCFIGVKSFLSEKMFDIEKQNRNDKFMG